MAKSSKKKPSFGASGETRASADWVYRSDEKPGEGKQRAKAAPKEPARQAQPARASKPKTEAASGAAPSDRAAAAHALVDRYTKYSSAAGLVPLPIVDVVAIAGVQVTMLGALAEHYGVPYSRERGKTLIATILGGVVPSLAGQQMMRVFGPLAGMASVAGFAAAATYAVGHVFIAHFESGGTLLDLDIAQARQALADAIAPR